MYHKRNYSIIWIVVSLKKIIVVSILGFSSYTSIGLSLANSNEIVDLNKNTSRLSNNTNDYKDKLISYYLLDSEDIVKIKFKDIGLFTDNFKIDEDGFIKNLPEINKIYARGKTTSELKVDLINKYKEFLYNPQIDINIVAYRSIKIFVTGEVKNPGYFVFKSSSSNASSTNEEIPNQFPNLYEAIQKANGVTNYADISEVSVIRDNSISQGGGKIEAKVNLLNMLLTGDQSNNLRIYDGDSIYVPKSSSIIKDQVLAINKTNLNPNEILVYITGNVKKPGSFKLRKGSSLVQAIASTGGKKLFTGNVEFLRFKRDGNTEKLSFRYNSKAPTNSKKNPILMDGDVINVRRSLPGTITAVTNEIQSPILSVYGLYKLLD